MSALFGIVGARAVSPSVSARPPTAPLLLSSSSMHSVHDPSRGDYPPLPKRPRVSNPPPPSAFMPSPPGPSGAGIPDQDGAADAASKKNRKRPLSCGECRRCVSLVCHAACDSLPPFVRSG